MEPVQDPEQAVRAVLDDFHLAASQADGERYFAHLAPDAIFFGTDASERWTVSELQAFAEPYFAAGTGWTAKATERNVFLAEGGRFAWFDERVESSRHGEMRGSGVLRQRGDRWRIVQYNLAFPVPNELAPDLVKQIRALAEKK